MLVSRRGSKNVALLSSLVRTSSEARHSRTHNPLCRRGDGSHRKLCPQGVVGGINRVVVSRCVCPCASPPVSCPSDQRQVSFYFDFLLFLPLPPLNVSVSVAKAFSVCLLTRIKLSKLFIVSNVSRILVWAEVWALRRVSVVGFHPHKDDTRTHTISIQRHLVDVFVNWIYPPVCGVCF